MASGSATYRIYLVEDDPKIATIVAEHLRKYEYEVHPAEKFDEIKQEFRSYQPHLVLLDINLPYFDGFYWCRQIRSIATTPVIFLTARSGEMDQVMAIENGGDDYIVKPFNLDVLTAKVKSVLRRAHGEYAQRDAGFATDEAVAEYRGLRWDAGRLEVQYETERTTVSRNEAMLLDALMRAEGRVVSRERLLEALWDDVAFVDDNTLTVNVTRLRRRLEELGAQDAVETVRGVGYRLALAEGAADR